MKIEILEPFLHQGQRFEADEVRVVDDATGAYFCRCGWAKDQAGKIKTIPRDPNRTVKLEVASSAVAQNTEEAG